MITTTLYDLKTLHRHAYFLCTYVPHFCMPPIMQVLLSQIRDPVHNEYQQQCTNYFSRLLSWQRGQQLKEKIEYEDYPPCIHMDVMYDDPAVRQEVVTTLKICTLCEKTNFSLTMKVPSELPPMCLLCL